MDDTAFAGSVRAARGRYVALINNDTRADAGWLEAHLRTLEEGGDGVACSSGRIVDWSGEYVDFIRGIWTFDGHAFQHHQGKPCNKLEEEFTPCSLPFPCGGNMMMEREEFLRLGGFDEDFFAYLEDVDLGWRMGLTGRGILYQSDALIYHRGSATGLKLGLFKRAFLFEKNAYMVAYKNMEDDVLQGLNGAILLTFMHRMDRLLVQEPALHRDLMVNPYESTHHPRRVSVRSEHARNHLRAYHWLMSHGRLLQEKRDRVQKTRVVSDRELFESFPLHIIPTYPGDDLLFSGPLFHASLPSDLHFVRLTLAQVISS